MNRLLRQTDELIRLNLRQLAAFEMLYRLVAGIFYLRLADGLLRFSLRMAGYSYLTMSNMGAFLLRPVTILCLLTALVLGMVLMLFEIGGLLTAYQAAAYSRRVDLPGIVKGALGKLRDECEKRSWRLLLLALANYLLMNSYILLRIMTRIRPFNFLLDEILHSPGGRLAMVLLSVFLVLTGIPTMLVFFACMIEQKDFTDGIRRSRELIAGRWHQAVLVLMLANILLLGALVVIHTITLVIAAVPVALLADSHAAAAVLSVVSTRLELALLFIGSLAVSVVDFGALTVVYYQFERHSAQREDWEIALPLGRGSSKKRWFLAVTGGMAGAAAFMVFDMVYNGTGSNWSALGEVEITAHRGSSSRAPENTMAAIREAMNEMADYSEIDVQLTSDGVVVLAHDRNLQRVAGVNRQLESMSWEELQQLDVGSYFGPDWAGEKIPSLEQVLEACKGKIRLNIELKDLGRSSSLPEKTAALVREYEMEEQCVLTSVRLSYLERVKEIDPQLRTGYILAAAYGRYYENEAVDVISLRASLATRGLVEAIHENGKMLHVWTVNSRTEIDRMRHLGVDNIITDYPARAREVLFGEAAVGLLEYLKTVMR